MAYRSDVRRQFYSDLMSDAIMAIRYWAEVSNGNEDLTAYTVTEDESGRSWALTIDDIARGWQELVKREQAGTFHHCNLDTSVRDAERSLQTRDGGEDYDACVCDAVIQLATLEGIVYG